nr:MAG TPA: hypothetical protein [Caudoviricetes sp.]
MAVAASILIVPVMMIEAAVVVPVLYGLEVMLLPDIC